MATVRDVVQGAYVRLALLPLGQDLDADRAAAGLIALNDLLASFLAHGIDAGLPTAVQLADAFPLPPKHVQGVKAMLATHLATASGMEPLATLQREAKQGWEALLAGYVTSPAASQDDAVTWLPSQRRYGFR